MTASFNAVQKKAVIAHRGASGYLPEHTLAAKAMAHAQGADFLEQDLVMTQDGHLVVLHDLFLDEVSNVAQRFAGAAREDGKYYAIDFTLAQLRDLTVNERVGADGLARLPNRFTPHQSRFSLNTFAEEIELLQGLNRSTRRVVGLYPEIKSPAWHHDHGVDLARAMLSTLQAYGYTQRDSGVVIQSFDATELQRVKHQLMPEIGLDLPLTQLLSSADQAHGSLAEIATYADYIGVSLPMLFDASHRTTRTVANPPQANPPQANDLVKEAHALGLSVHAYTVRADQLPPPFVAIDALHAFIFNEAKVDGVFTDFPDLTVRFLNQQ